MRNGRAQASGSFDPFPIPGSVGALVPFLLASVTLFIPDPAVAQGFGVYENGTCAMGRAAATAAEPCEDGSAIFYNPAGLADAEGVTVTGGATLVASHGAFTSDTGESRDLQSDPIPVPHLYATVGIEGDIGLGLGVFVPYALETAWPTEDFSGRFMGYDNGLQTRYVQPTVAWRAAPWMSVGGGVDVVFGTVKLNQRLDLAQQEIVVGLVTVLGLSACDDAALMPPEEPEAGAMFQRYVALGASITAGFESGGINDSTQAHSWPALLADAMGTEFNQPLLARPGCPPPFTNILEGTRVGGGDANSCGLRAQPIPTDLHHLAVPGAETSDVLNNLGPDSEANPLTQLILGGRTQIDAAADANPTFVSVFIGPNDILGVAQSGDLAPATPVQEFTADYRSLVSAVTALNPEGAVLVGVPNIFAVDLATGAVPVPFLSLGAAYAAAEGQPGWPPTFDVADNCAPESEFPDGKPGEASLVPFSYGFGALFAAAEQGQAVELDCLNDPEILTTTEWGHAAATMAAYNVVIRQAADAEGWEYVDATPVLTGLRDQGFVPPFPKLDAAPNLFGLVFSQDGIHLAEAGQAELAAAVARAIDATYGTTVARGGS